MDRHTYYFWFGFLVVSVAGGGFVVSIFSTGYRLLYDIRRPVEYESPSHFPGYLTGLVERVFFTLLIAASVPGSGVAMMAWLAARQLNTFQNKEDFKGKPVKSQYAREWHFSSAIFSFLNLFFAMIGALFVLHWKRAEQLLPLLKGSTDWCLARGDAGIWLLSLLAIVVAGITTWISQRVHSKYGKPWSDLPDEPPAMPAG